MIGEGFIVSFDINHVYTLYTLGDKFRPTLLGMISRGEITVENQHDSNISSSFSPCPCLNEYTIVIFDQTFGFSSETTEAPLTKKVLGSFVISSVREVHPIQPA